MVGDAYKLTMHTAQSIVADNGNKLDVLFLFRIFNRGAFSIDSQIGNQIASIWATPCNQWVNGRKLIWTSRAHKLSFDKECKRLKHSLMENYVIIMKWHLQMPLIKQQMHKQIPTIVDINQFCHFDRIRFGLNLLERLWFYEIANLHWKFNRQIFTQID